jgi:predicted MPP superfamily phosphohydrolase
MNWKLPALALAGAASAAWGYARFIEPMRFEIRKADVALPGLNPAFDGYRIVHLSDLHYDGAMTAARMAQIAALSNDLRPNLVAITGDFITAERGFDGAALSRFLRTLDAPDGIVGVLGNHDHVDHAHALRLTLADGGVRELENSSLTIQRGEARLHITGVDSLYRQRARLDKALAATPDDGAPAILLVHEPDMADAVAALGRFSLQLSGHAHAGQVALPLLVGLGLPAHGHRYTDGLYLVDDLYVYVSRGLGMTSMHIRFNARPEIALITLRA